MYTDKHRAKFYERYAKRTFDVMFSVIALILLSPFFLLCIIAVKLDDMHGSIFFKQDRNGKDGKVFAVIKFRTMKRELSGRHIAVATDTLTRVGRIMRKFSLDEIPQFINILRGEMSLIGPRPLLLAYYEWFNETERRRFDVLPGITGLSQINGRASLNWDERFALDVRYADNLSFLMDLKIFLRSFFVVFSHKDVMLDQDSSLERFDIYRKRMLEQQIENTVVQAFPHVNINAKSNRKTKAIHDSFAGSSRSVYDSEQLDIGS